MPTQIAINNAQTPPTAMPPIGPPDKELDVCFGIVDDLDVGIDVRPAAAGFVEMTVEVGRAVQNLLHVSAQSLESPKGGAPVIGLFCGFLSVFGPGAWARYHSPSPCPVQLTPMKAACRKARPSE